MYAHQRNAMMAVVVVTSLSVVLIGAAQGGSNSPAAVAITPSDSTPGSVVQDAEFGDVVDVPQDSTLGDIAFVSDEVDPAIVDAEVTGTVASTGDGCKMSVLSVRVGSEGDSVTCLQEALTAAGYYSGPISSYFDEATFSAVESMQVERNLYVDGVVGRETALSIGIWPDEESFVTRTPPPPEGATDSWGYPLSSVSSVGDDAPPLPPNSGSGRRVVYDRAGQRVWAVDDDGSIIRSWLVSGSQYSNEVPGEHQVYSRSKVSTAWNGRAYLPLMIRWLKTERGAIGFHGIPLHVEDNSPYQTEKELGTRLSGGCQRQANADAKFLWDFADIGTTVFVV